MNQYKDELFLRDYGFKRKYLSDKSGWWLEYKSKNKILKNCVIVIDEKEIYVDVDVDHHFKYKMKTSVTIVKKKLNRENLFNLLFMFK